VSSEGAELATGYAVVMVAVELVRMAVVRAVAASGERGCVT
jgi:hypothetical protein